MFTNISKYFQKMCCEIAQEHKKVTENYRFKNYICNVTQSLMWQGFVGF